MNKIKVLALFILLPLTLTLSAHYDNNSFEWPQTPASKVFQDFVKAFNSGKEKQLETFVKKHYKNIEETYVYSKVENWMDMFYRFGAIKTNSISINESHDLEIWLQGKVSKAWFAVEFILDKETDKVKGVGILQGALPQDISMGNINDFTMLNDFKQYLEENEKHQLFQGVVLLQKDNEILLNRAYGYKNLSLGIKNTNDTRFDYMSITKLITAVACMQLVQQGILDLHIPIDNYLPKLPKHIASQINLEMLLSHTSGYELDGIKGFREKLTKVTSMQEVYQLQLRYLPKWEYFDTFQPNKKYDYANDSFDLVAIIIEKVTQMKFEDYLKQYIFDIAGMTTTSFNNKDVALRYRYDLSVKDLMDHSSYYPIDMGMISGAAGLIGTVEDLRLFFSALIKSNKLLDFTHRNILFSPKVTESKATNIYMNNPFVSIDEKALKAYNGYGLGTEVSYDSQLNVGHSGTGIGSSSQIRYFPDSGYLLVILANNRNGGSNVYNFFKNSLPRE